MKITYADYLKFTDEYGDFYPVRLGREIYEYHHAAAFGGYVSRRKDAELHVEEYAGIFGVGYRVHLPRFNTTQFHTVVYYIKRHDE